MVNMFFSGSEKTARVYELPSDFICCYKNKLRTNTESSIYHKYKKAANTAPMILPFFYISDYNNAALKKTYYDK